MNLSNRMDGRLIWKFLFAVIVFVPVLALAACDSAKYESERTYISFDVADSLGITFDTAIGFVERTDETTAASLASIEYTIGSYLMHTVTSLELYAAPGDAQPSAVLPPETDIILTDDGSGWASITAPDGTLLGYTNAGYEKAINRACALYAELPIEYGTARNADDSLTEAYSQLVDLNKYLTIYYSTDESNEGVDLSAYDVKASLMLTTDSTVIGRPFYSRNLCLLQLGTLQKLMKAIETFKRDGYTLVIYDAYRPTSIQQRWFDEATTPNGVADPTVGMGGIHDRGAAVDISLIDEEGIPFEMPTAVYTMTEESARGNAGLSRNARINLNYITGVMKSCGFSDSPDNWWHYEDNDAASYLPTDHAIDEIPLVASESVTGNAGRSEGGHE